MKKHLYVANWKMFLSYNEVKEWLSRHQSHCANLARTNEIILCPSAESLTEVAKIAQERNISVGAQECSAQETGAFTGQISAKSLHELGCSFCIVGHSEQRALQKNYDVVGRISQLIQYKITPIVCISQVTPEDMEPIKQMLSQYPHKKLCIAYEPLESIGTGVIAPSNAIINVIREIKKQLPEATSCTILYGGSVTPDSVKVLKAIDELDGFLIGSASADGDRFVAIITA